MSNFIIAATITEVIFRTTIALFPTLITFYKIYCAFGMTIKRLVNVINFLRFLLFKIEVFFVSL